MFQLETTAKVVANNPENAGNQKDGPSLIHGLGVTAWEISRVLQPQGVGPPARSSLASGAAAVRPDHGKRWVMARQTPCPGSQSEYGSTIRMRRDLPRPPHLFMLFLPLHHKEKDCCGKAPLIAKAPWRAPEIQG